MMSTTAKVALALMLLGSESFGARRRSHHGEAVHRTTLKDCDNRYRRSRSKALVRVVSAIGGGCIRPAGHKRRRRLLTDVSGA